MITLNPYDAKVAYSMIRAASRIKPTHPNYNPIEKYTYLWIAFNNIYQTITDYKGRSAELRRLPDGTIETKYVDNLQMPKVSLPTEREQIDLTIEEFNEDLKERLIKNENTIFFAYRTPRFHGMPIENDAFGQRLNGVINVSQTVSIDYPVWSAIDVNIYERYMSGACTNHDDIDFLVKQIIYVLYSVRNNLFHGGKRMDDSSDTEVVDKAIPLLKMVVSSFTR